MGTEVLKSFGTLQFELEQAKISLKDVDENIKRLIGRDPSENQRIGSKRSASAANRDNDEPRGRPRINNNRTKQNFENDEPVQKKRNVESNVFKRLSERTSTRHYEDDLPELHSKQLISKVIVTPKEVPTRQDVLKAQSADEKSKARNRRMFGALLGTLQKFRQEETKLKPKEEKRAQVEKKLEEQQIKEREELKKERADLFYNRKKKQAEIRMIELKMTRMKEHSEWEEKQKPLMNFIQTKSKPHIYYLPKILNEQNKKLLDSCKTNLEKSIDRKRQEVFAELTAIENRMKKNFTRKCDKDDEKHDDEHMDHDDHIENDDHEDDHHDDHDHLKKEDEIQDHSTIINIVDNIERIEELDKVSNKEELIEETNIVLKTENDNEVGDKDSKTENEKDELETREDNKLEVKTEDITDKQ